MDRFLAGAVALMFIVSCSKSNEQPQVTPIPDVIQGTVTEFNITPVDLNTPGTGTFVISMNDARYKVQFNAVDQSESNATMIFENDTLLTNDSREFGNFGQDVVAYAPLRENEIVVTFNQGSRRITGNFTAASSFGGTFGRDVIEQWREPNDPAKPNQKAKTDLVNLIRLYSDRNGTEPGMAPLHLKVSIARQ